MAIKIVVQEAKDPDLLPEGIYSASVIDVEKGSSQYGPFIKIWFEITDTNMHGKTICLITSLSLSLYKSGRRSRLCALFKTITGEDLAVGMEIDLDTLKGKPCRISVKNQPSKNGIIFSNIAEVMPSDEIKI